ncbi:MAG: FAD-binding protein [Gemmatimonadaceae bacterium]|nr:FAD-binding protein [Gemmatimonadaceae bacterium]
MPPTTTASTESLPDFRGVFRTDLLARSLYAEGAGIARAVPVAVAVPADAADCIPLVRWARRTGHSLMPRGSGSGMAGGAVGAGVMVDLSRFTAIGPVDIAARSIRVGTGALRGAVDTAARAHGLRFPVDPSSGAFCTVGGMIAANAAGARSLRFGATRAWVRAVKCVFDDGSVAWIRRGSPPPAGIPAVARLMATLAQLRQHANPDSLRHAGVRKESSGYGIASALDEGGHLLDLLVGSEGTLALFVEAELALCPVAGATATVLAAFPSLDHATACALEVRELGASACELLDRTFLDVAGSAGPIGIAATAEAVLLIEVEADTAGAAEQAALVTADRCRANAANEVITALDGETEHRLWSLRHAVSPILSRLAPRLRSMQFVEDGCVPPQHFPAYVRGVRAALSRFHVTGVIFGHAGDAHAHVNPLVDVTQPHWRQTVSGILDEVAELTARLGGTLAGEHGDGRLRAPLLERVWNAEARAAFVNVKNAADPSGVFNVGCKVAMAGDQAIGVLRHDPDAPPLDARARAVLDRIERERAWQRFRLEATAWAEPVNR